MLNWQNIRNAATHTLGIIVKNDTTKLDRVLN